MDICALIATRKDSKRIKNKSIIKFGLSNLTIIADCFDAIKINRNQELSINTIDLEDNKTFDLLSEGKTMGVFQLEGSGMKRYIQELKPTTLSDVSAMIALFFACSDKPFGLPPFRPRARADSRPALVRSLIMSRSNSARAANK